MKEKERTFLRIEDEDKEKIQLSHLDFGYESYACIHSWSFNSPEEAREAKAIILEFCPNAKDKF